MHAEHAERAVVATVAVAGVADQVMRGMLEMAADLAETPGDRTRAQQRVARGRESRRRDREFHGGQPREAGDRRLFQRLPGAAVERMIDDELLVGPTAAHGEVVLFDSRRLGHAVVASRHHRLAERAGGVAIERQQQAAAGGAIEPVHEEHRPTELRAQAVGGEIGFAARQRAVVDHQAGRFVDDGQLRVGMQDAQWRGFRAGCDLRQAAGRVR